MMRISLLVRMHLISKLSGYRENNNQQDYHHSMVSLYIWELVILNVGEPELWYSPELQDSLSLAYPEVCWGCSELPSIWILVVLVN